MPIEVHWKLPRAMNMVWVILDGEMMWQDPNVPVSLVYGRKSADREKANLVGVGRLIGSNVKSTYIDLTGSSDFACNLENPFGFIFVGNMKALLSSNSWGERRQVKAEFLFCQNHADESKGEEQIQ